MILIMNSTRARKRIVALIPPHPREIWEQQQAFFSAYNWRALSGFHSDDTVVDFSPPRYPAFADSPGNFPDGVHISNAGAEFLVQEMNKLLTPGVQRTVAERLREAPTAP